MGAVGYSKTSVVSSFLDTVLHLAEDATCSDYYVKVISTLQLPPKRRYYFHSSIQCYIQKTMQWKAIATSKPLRPWNKGGSRFLRNVDSIFIPRHSVTPRRHNEFQPWLTFNVCCGKLSGNEYLQTSSITYTVHYRRTTNQKKFQLPICLKVTDFQKT
jgi:hypothetical protein